MKDNKEDKNIKEDISKYGEFVSSFFSWMTLDRTKTKSKRFRKYDKK